MHEALDLVGRVRFVTDDVEAGGAARAGQKLRRPKAENRVQRGGARGRSAGPQVWLGRSLAHLGPRRRRDGVSLDSLPPAANNGGQGQA